MQELDGYPAAAALVSRPPDLSHPPARQSRLEPVPSEDPARVGSAAMVDVARMLEGTRVLRIPSVRRALRPLDVSR